MASILITGCSTGIGRAAALRFASKGYRVFAGVRKEADAESLASEDASGNLEPLMLDITNEAQLSAVMQRLETELAGQGLDALVNNAAADVAGFIEYVDPDIVRMLHEVNVIGPLKLTQATLPLIRKATGRIVNISSIAGKVSLPLEGPYSMSKFALEAMTDALRFELRDSGIKVSLIEPGPIKTPMLLGLGVRAQTVLDSLPPEGADYYGDLVRAMLNQSQDLSDRAETPEDVAALIEHAVESPDPKIRYLITKDAKQLKFIRSILPDKAFDAVMKMQYLS